MTSRTSDELLATTGKLYWHVPVLAWSARVRSGDLLSRGARRRRDARVRRFRGIRQLFGASHLALSFPSSVAVLTQLTTIPFSKLFGCGHSRRADECRNVESTSMQRANCHSQ